MWGRTTRRSTSTASGGQPRSAPATTSKIVQVISGRCLSGALLGRNPMQVFQRILGIILPVFIIIALGYGYARLRGDSVKADMAAVNRVSMGMLCPLLV